MTKKQATDKLYVMWESGELPANFTEDHSMYGNMVNYLMKYGKLPGDILGWLSTRKS